MSGTQDGRPSVWRARVDGELPGLVFHIPHGSRALPPPAVSGIIAPPEVLASETALLVDHDVEELFSPAVHERDLVLSFPWSRLLVDVERFRDEAAEPMSRHGMGAVYLRTSDGKPLRDGSLDREALLLAYYDPHHNRLSAAVAGAISRQGFALIIDCHSYPRLPFPWEDKRARRPELCLGADARHTPGWLLEAIGGSLAGEGLDVAVNTPFEGTMVPRDWQGDARVFSIMIEVRRDLYLEGGASWRQGDRLHAGRILAAALQRAREAAGRYAIEED